MTAPGCDLPPFVLSWPREERADVPALGMGTLVPEDWCAGPLASPSVELHVLALERLSDVAHELACLVRAGVPGNVRRLEAMTASVLRTAEALGYVAVTGQRVGPEDCAPARGWAVCAGCVLGPVFGDVCAGGL